MGGRDLSLAVVNRTPQPSQYMLEETFDKRTPGVEALGLPDTAENVVVLLDDDRIESINRYIERAL